MTSRAATVPLGQRGATERHRELPLLMAIWFASGSAALIYQVLWVRGLGLLFGSTAEAAAITIAIFFAGMMSGGWYWGRRAPDLKNALLGFGFLELAVAGTALGHFLLLDVYHAIYPSLFALVGSVRTVDTLAKAVVAATILLPPAFLMGGTLPVMGQYLIRHREQLGKTGSALYAVNTAGGAIGALGAGFFLPLRLGFTGAYLLAVGIDLLVGGIAIWMAVTIVRHRSHDVRAVPPARRGRGNLPGTGASTPSSELELALPVVWLVAFASGVATLGIQVIWTRLFSQVLQNSAYTYSLVLTTFLVALALGSTLANGLCRVRRPTPVGVLATLLAGSVVVTVASPWLFQRFTGGLGYIGGQHGWAAYIADVVLLAAQVMLVPTIVLGAVLPYLLRALQGSGHAPGAAIGRLVAANTAGAMLGSLGAGFVLLPTLGAARSLMVLACVYAGLLTLVVLRGFGRYRLPTAAGAIGAGLLLLILPSGGLQSITLDPMVDERLIELQEGTAAHVAVVERQGELSLRVNNYYTLGSTNTMVVERNQAIVPMLTHAAPRSVFFLGLGTGMSAGASLFFPVERVVVCELLPEVVDLSRRHFSPWLNGLFEDERVTVYAEDGRNCLRRSSERYDVIISDLFTPWHAGTGNLYTVEHYRTVRDRLEPGGIFAQWLALYQVSEVELGIIARTMQEVFPEVVMWRADLSPELSSIALIGQAQSTRLDPEVLVANVREIGGDPDLPAAQAEQLVMRFYAGNVTLSGLFDDDSVNTDNRPLIEYLAPRTYREVVAGRSEWLIGAARNRLYRRLLETVPPERDPYLSRLTAEQRGHVLQALEDLERRW